MHSWVPLRAIAIEIETIDYFQRFGFFYTPCIRKLANINLNHRLYQTSFKIDIAVLDHNIKTK